MTDVVLSVDRLSVSFGRVQAVRDVGFQLASGEILGVMGPNGAGKTTMLNAIAGLIPRSRGDVRLGSTRLRRQPTYWRVRKGLAVASQRPRLFDDLTVSDQMALIRYQSSGGRGPADIERILDECGIGELGGLYPGQLSPSDLRRLELAKALASSPSVLLLDEVGAGLPDSEVEHVARVIRSAASSGCGVLVVDHMMPLLLAVSSRLLVLDLGRVIADGAPDDVLDMTSVADAYFGTATVGDEERA